MTHPGLGTEVEGGLLAVEEQGSWQPVKRPGGGGSDEATKRPKDSTELNDRTRTPCIGDRPNLFTQFY